MKLASVWHEGRRRAAVVLDGSLALVPEDLGQLEDIVRSSTVDEVRRALPGYPRIPLDPSSLDAPLRRFRRDVLCVGWNYWDHFEESKGRREGQEPPARPDHPTFFTKGPDTVLPPAAAIPYDPVLSRKWDYEAELAIVFGRTGRNIPEEKAWDHVFGVCVANDVSLRDLQRAHGGQWFKGKSVDGTLPLGPWITTLDELPDKTDLHIECVLNGTVMQSASTRSMAFPIERLIAELSRGMTVRAGDLLLTGTPSGVGNARDPQVFLRDGDVLTTRISGLGSLVNEIRAVERPGAAT
ncbi:fumarylacetoacetate hydrolase family protein [Amycolatopsis jejuensis]|uniref:fumarylacetoacetate hydrolase family protein n=1 Tax=Amycolatopsis jejuensis TaxID=330084 RepID=UPI000526D78D|nr:fumarylacetoacetate hydrolase family protein [Amycolatopsis jejuensis]